MNPEKVGLFGALIATAIMAINTNRDDPKQKELHEEAEGKTNELIEAIGLGDEEGNKLRDSIKELMLNASAARTPSEDNRNSVKELVSGKREDYSTEASRNAERERRDQRPPEQQSRPPGNEAS